MNLVARTLRWQRIVLNAVLVLSAVALWRDSFDVFNTTKATIVALGAIAIVAIGAVRVSRTRVLRIPQTPAWYPVGAFVVALVVATLVSPAPLRSIVGQPGRHTGLAMYLVYAVLLAVVVRLYRDESPAGLIGALLAAAVPVSLYGLVQAAGLDPWTWNTVEGGPPVFSTFGNANFFAAWLGIVVPLCLWAALSVRLAPLWRAGAGMLGVAAFAAAALSRSLQGPAVALVGSAFVLAVWLYSADEGPRLRLRRPLLAGGAVLGVVGVAGVTAGIGPLAGIRAGAAGSLGTRTPKWEAALAMFADRPLLGFGLDNFGDWFFRYRSFELAAETGLRRSTDTPHNVPLDMLAAGGLLLGLAYLAVIAVTAWALVRGLRRLQGEERLLLGGLGGAWLAYQVQSFVSIDVPPLAVLHWVLAGLIVAAGTSPPFREVVLPGARKLAEAKPGASRKAKERARQRALTPPSPVLLGVIGVVTVALLWPATTPLRADLVAFDAAEARSDAEQALALYERAAAIAPWEARYLALAGEFLAGEDRAADALARFEAAAAREPRGLAHQLNIAHTAIAAGDEQRAARAYDRVLELDPKTPQVLAEVGQFRLGRGDADAAAELLERAVTLQDGNATWWVALGEARSAEGDVDGAERAYQQALDIDPDAEGARAALDRLS